MGITQEQYLDMMRRLETSPTRLAPKEDDAEREVGHGGLVEKCLDYADKQWPPWPHWGARTDKKSTLGVGVHDQTFVLHGGKFLCVEFKAKNKKRTEEQQIWATRMAMVGVTVWGVRNFEWFVELARQTIEAK